MSESDPLLAVAFCSNARDVPTQSEQVRSSVLIKKAFSRHVEQPRKDGLGFIFADLNGGRRDDNVKSVSCLGFDIDGKLSASRVNSAVSAAAVMAVVYTTYNHLRTESTVAAKSYRKWAAANGHGEAPTDASVQAFCAAHSKSDHLTSVRVGNGGDTVRVKERGCVYDAFVIEHDPEHKIRVLFPAAHAIPIAVVGIDGYKAIYHAVGRHQFGDTYDRSCSNPARLHYGPSCRPGAKGHVIEHHAGTFFDWEPIYELLKDNLDKRRDESARRHAEWMNSSPGSLAELDYVLNVIPSDACHDEWFKVLGGIHHETRGSEEGRALAHEWSARDYDAYDANEIDTIWDGFDLDCQHPATMGTLVRLAREYDATFNSGFLTILRSAREFSEDVNG